MNTLLISSLKLLDTDKLNNELLPQKNTNWLFSYDLATNFIIIAAIFKHKPQIISGQDLAKILKILTDHEVQAGGPYFNQDKQIDLTTNIAIAYFLSLNEVSLPNLGKLIKEATTLSEVDKYLLSLFNQTIIPAGKDDSVDDLMIAKIVEVARDRFKNLDDNLKTIALEEIDRTLKKNKDKQMSLMAYYFRLALGKNGTMISDEFVTQAGLANIFYWTAFIIYDDFWDEDDKAIPRILPAANLYARHYTDFYSQDPEFRTFFHNLMDKLDAANTWETIYCRTKVINSKFIIPDQLPEYGNYDWKFYPASGQILGPMAMLTKVGYDLESKEASDLTNYFRNYLIAMQINDDAHDYIEDMERGHLSTVVVMLLKDWKIKYPEQKEIDLVSDLKKLQELFWFKTIKTACELAVNYTAKSREALVKLHFLENPTPLAHFIDIAENVAKTALDEQQKSLDFLDRWTNDNQI